ncbi:DUF5362 family protein [Mariniblastus fucicola]|uniref:Uncharacterized protein n=1 Tax=Mariniblastus fucicola TaxID=980251 RepID=A0A5B9PKX6_9BACT|nr:DUF5362 family protein [Mariniblastus fucicola]QEG23063.1 hypothetical protein MFFC18_29550 [Mariniblastus fucicola]
MPIKFNCHKCGASLRVPEQHIGKKARCPKCDEKCVVPATSQGSESGSEGGEEFEDIGNVLEHPATATPVGLPPAIGAPTAVPTAAPLPPGSSDPPAMASPVAPPFQSNSASPYASPIGKPQGNAISGSIMHPLYEARNMMKIWGWLTFIVGILYCLTIVGIIVAWVFIWMGWLVKGAAEAVTIGIETGDMAQLRLANERLGTFFKILGVGAIIWLALVGIYLLIVIVAIIIGVAGAAAG